jgi:hypothetical protein
MVSFLFWNLHGNPLQSAVAKIAIRRRIDVIMLVECQIRPAVLLEVLNENESRFHYAAGIGCKKVELHTAFSKEFMTPIYETERLTIRNLKLPGLPNALLA